MGLKDFFCSTKLVGRTTKKIKRLGIAVVGTSIMDNNSQYPCVNCCVYGYTHLMIPRLMMYIFDRA